jgi:hypothetical protein
MDRIGIGLWEMFEDSRRREEARYQSGGTTTECGAGAGPTAGEEEMRNVFGQAARASVHMVHYRFP